MIRAPKAIKPQPGRPPAQVLRRECARCGAPQTPVGRCVGCGSETALHPRLPIGAADHPAEREADRAAEQALAGRSPPAVRPLPVALHRHDPFDDHGWAEAPPVVHRVLGRPGRPLDGPLRRDMESRFGQDFSRVRVHTDSEAGQSARDVGASAYTVGTDIAFAPGRYAPASAEGRRLLAHELAHVTQQNGAAKSLQRVPDSGGGPPRPGPGTLPYREATELAECLRIMGPEAVDYCRHEVLGEPYPRSWTVSRIDIVDSPAGAISGYPRITSGDLNVPGPWNSATTGGVSNVHQIHFTLDHGDSAAVTATRTLQRSAWVAGVEHRNPADNAPPPGAHGPTAPGGFNGVLVGPDGPAAHEVRRPDSTKIVVADAPGAAALTAAQFPFRYSSHFVVTVTHGSTDLARAAYDVHIEKTDAANIPNVVNSITAVSKRDLVRQRDL